MNSFMREIFIDDDNAVVAKVSVVSNLIKRENAFIAWTACFATTAADKKCSDHNSEKMVWISFQFCIECIDYTV